MKNRTFAALSASAFLAACEPAGEPDPPPVTPQTSAAVGATPSPEPAPSATTTFAEPNPVDVRPQLVAEALILAEWGKAENKDSCAPMAFNSTGSARGAPRPANFGGGWAIAFDLPNLRSAYGLAGTGVLSSDVNPSEADRAALMKQWPYFRELAQLPQPAFAGYGVEGAAAYPADNPSGRGINSLAYVRIGGERCLYNVWSRLGRRHLEKLLEALRPVRT